MRYYKHNKQHKGFSLLELLITAALLGYTLSAVLLTYIFGQMLNDASRNLTVATTHAQYILENIKNTTFSSIATNITGGTWNWNTAAVTAQGLSALKSESTSVSSTGTNPLDITVTINWNDTKSRSRNYIIKTSIGG